MSLKIKVEKKRIGEFCRKHHIRRLAFFGSVLREEFGPDSDVDVLIEFEPGTVVGFFKLVGMEQEFSEMIGRKADFRTPQDLSRYFRDEVIARAEVQYAA